MSKKPASVISQTVHEEKAPRLDTTIVKGITVMELLARADTPLSVTELSKATDLQKSNIHRILRTLMELGYVQKDERTTRYQLNLKIWEIGSRVIERNLLRRISRPFVRSLHEETHEAVFLSVLIGTEILYIDSLDAVFPLRENVRLGSRAPLQFTASGKAILAFQPDAETLARRLVKENATGRSIDVKVLLVQIAETRRRGFACSINGWTAGISSVAAPIITRNMGAFAAIGIGGPTERFDDKRVAELSRLVLNAATRISEIVGTNA